MTGSWRNCRACRRAQKRMAADVNISKRTHAKIHGADHALTMSLPLGDRINGALEAAHAAYEPPKSISPRVLKVSVAAALHDMDILNREPWKTMVEDSVRREINSRVEASMQALTGSLRDMAVTQMQQHLRDNFHPRVSITATIDRNSLGAAPAQGRPGEPPDGGLRFREQEAPPQGPAGNVSGVGPDGRRPGLLEIE